MSSEFGYINARLKGKHSQLLKAGAYQELLALPDFASVEKWMEGGPYAREWQSAKVRYKGLEAVEWALEKNFCHLTGLLLSISEGQPLKLIGIILSRWDLANLNAVVRGIHAGWSAQEIQRSLLPAGRLDDVKLMELCTRTTLDDLADTLVTWEHQLGVTLKRSLEQYAKDKDAVAVELSLYREFYRNSLSNLKGWGHNASLLRRLLKKEIDLLNLKAVRLLKGKKDLEPSSLTSYYIPGGSLFSAASFTGLFDRREGPKILRAMKSNIYYRWIADIKPDPEQTLVLEQKHYRELAGLYRGDPLGIDVVLGFLWQKYYEVVNLRFLARGKFYGLSAEQIRNELITVNPF